MSHRDTVTATIHRLVDAGGNTDYDELEAAIDTALTGHAIIPIPLLRQLTEVAGDGDCWFDHHGNCQEHGFSLEVGEVCPQILAHQLLKDAEA